ncbi:hypothetical protein AA0117_g7987 [Alternaria alternata]|uniref:Uncharacterized protein n=1 Tax=Alternaria alternata TaxID=5599 RepID=A0A4Q4NCP3_ALTAL|nr:hypothetical protein AA0117_g7987 [Alternaria alternata]
MSRALVKAPKLSPHDRLDQAVSEFQASLSDAQKSQYDKGKSAPTPSDVMKLSEEVDVHLSQKFGGRCFGPRFTNFLHGVQQFAALGDILIGGSQNLIACGVWSLVRLTLLSFVSVSNHVDKLSSIFMDIGRSAPRHQAIVELYPRSTKLQEYLSEYFVVVVRLCHHLCKLGQKSTFGQITSSLNQTALMGFQTDLEKWASSIREEMRLREAQENSGFREESRSIFKFVTEEQKRAKQRQIQAAKAATKNKVLDFFSKYDYETAQKQIRKAGNTSLHKRHVQYQEWKDSLDSCTVVFTGKLGSGKSVLLANIVGDLNLSTAKEPPLVAYFFCRHDIQESLQARTILGSLARQLLRTLDDLEILSENGGNSHIASSTDRILDSFLKGYSPSHMTYFVIDGLDECDETERRILVDAFQKIQKKLKALFCISLRIEPNKSLSFITEQLLATRVVPLPEKNPDIDAFIEADLNRCLEQELLTIGDPTLIIDIQDALVAGSQGMFLWAALQIQSLCSMKTDHAIRKALADLPKDISQTFARILDKSGRSDPSLQAKTLQVVLAAERPLTTEELREALSVIPGDADWNPSKMLNDVYSALTCCGCLLTVDEEESTVRVVHHSVKQYILHGLNDAKHTSFSIDDAQRTLADIVVTYLGYGVFETQLSRVDIRPTVPQSVPSSILQSAMGSSSTARNLAMRILANRKQPTFDLSKTIAEVRSSSNCQPEDAFKLYSYAKKHLQRHIWYVSGHQGSIYKLAAKAIQSQTFEIQKDPSSLTACGWAAEHGNMKLVELLFQASQYKADVVDDSFTPLLWAICFGRQDVVKALLSADVDVNERSSHQMALIEPITDTPLGAAVKINDKEMVELLLKSEGIDVNAKDKYGKSAIIVAVEGGYEDIVEVLLKSEGIDVNAKDKYGKSAIIVAVEGGYEDIVEVLLKSEGIDVNAQDANGDTALMNTTCFMPSDSRPPIGVAKLLLDTGKADPNLHSKVGDTALIYAAKYGYVDYVELLLASGSDPNLADYMGQTALMKAAKYGHYVVVELLINNKDVDLNAEDGIGLTALMHAVLLGDLELVRLLFNNKDVDRNAKDSRGQTAHMLAKSGRRKDIAKLLDPFRLL